MSVSALMSPLLPCSGWGWGQGLLASGAGDSSDRAADFHSRALCHLSVRLSHFNNVNIGQTQAREYSVSGCSLTGNALDHTCTLDGYSSS